MRVTRTTTIGTLTSTTIVEIPEHDDGEECDGAALATKADLDRAVQQIGDYIGRAHRAEMHEIATQIEALTAGNVTDEQVKQLQAIGQKIKAIAALATNPSTSTP